MTEDIQEETTDDLIKRLNAERATLRARGQELERILRAWRPILRLVDVDMDEGPEGAGDTVSQTCALARLVPQLREKLAAYEGQMLYRIEANGNSGGYDPPDAIVVKNGDQICGCHDMDDAAKVAAALNRNPEKDNVG